MNATYKNVPACRYDFQYLSSFVSICPYRRDSILRAKGHMKMGWKGRVACLQAVQACLRIGRCIAGHA